MDRAVSRRVAVLALPLTVAAGRCDLSLGNLSARATDEWTHTYPLTAGGEVRIVNTNGRIEVEGVDGSTVEVRAERIAKGATEAAAQELLPRIVIKEDVKPDRVSLETERMSGIMIGAGFEVRYHVRAPKNALVNVTNTNGLVDRDRARRQGRRAHHQRRREGHGADAAASTRARPTAASPSRWRRSGRIRSRWRRPTAASSLALPEQAKATVTASCTNGGISVGSLDNFEVTEKSRRHLEGKLNGGGTAVELHTTNGGVRLRSRDSINTRTDTDATDERKDR